MKQTSTTTLQTIARAAGVTPMTVSVVINGARSSTRVSEATRARVLEAAQRLGYRRNAAALGLSRRRMNTLGLAAAIDSGEMNLYFLALLNGILEAAAERGQNTTVLAVSDWLQDESRLLNFCDGRIDGLIFIGPFFSPTFAASLPSDVPFVAIHSGTTLPHIPNLEIDDEAGAFLLVQHLIATGHRRIAHFSGGDNNPGGRKRVQGYRRALEAAGLPIDEALIFDANFSAFSGRIQAEALLARWPISSPARPTAIFCASDALAYGCMEILARHRVRVPDEISVAGFDDTLLARMTIPPLTTVRQPFHEMGKSAVETLLTLIDRNAMPPNASPENTNGGQSEQAPPAEPEPLIASETQVPTLSKIFPVELIIRESVGPPPR